MSCRKQIGEMFDQHTWEVECVNCFWVTLRVRQWASAKSLSYYNWHWPPTDPCEHADISQRHPDLKTLLQNHLANYWVVKKEPRIGNVLEGICVTEFAIRGTLQ